MVFYLAMFPVIWVLNAVSRLVLCIFGLRRASEVEMLHSPEELRLILQRVELEPGARRVIDRLFDYTHRLARQVMTLRRNVAVLDARRSWDENLRVALANQYTRYPVVEGETDRVLGYVHSRISCPRLARIVVREISASWCESPSTLQRRLRSSNYAAISCVDGSIWR